MSAEAIRDKFSKIETLFNFQTPEFRSRRFKTQRDNDKSEVATNMFEKPIDYPCAIADHTEEGARAAFQWARQHVREGQQLMLWVPQKNILNNNEFLRALAKREGQDLTIAAGKNVYRVNGPVLAMYPDPDNLAYTAAAHGVTALAVVQWSSPLDTWAKEVNAEVLHTCEPEVEQRMLLTGSEPEPELAPVVVHALERITQLINHNNTISAGREKRDVVGPLLRLHDDGVPLPAKKMAEWAVAHGWRSDNPKELIEWVGKINAGVRPRVPRY
nr:hypothetical protein [Schaalia odontolytica]